MSTSASITDRRHNDYVGNDANTGRIPGADNASSGHHFVAVFPKGKTSFFWSFDPSKIVMEEEGAPKQSDQVLRPQEHLPPPTGRDVPPNTGRRVPSDPQPEFVSSKYMPGNKIAPNGMFLCGPKRGVIQS